MKITKRLFAYLIFASFFSVVYGQSDVVITKEGRVIKGKVLEHNKEYVKIMDKDSLVFTYPADAVNDIKFNVEKAEALTKANDSIRLKKRLDAAKADAYKPSIEEMDLSAIPKPYLTQRKIGIGLMVAGPGLCAIGVIMIAANPGNTHSYSGPGYAGATFTGAAAAGLLLNVVGVPVLIAGIIKLVTANKRIRRYLSRGAHPKA